MGSVCLLFDQRGGIDVLPKWTNFNTTRPLAAQQDDRAKLAHALRNSPPRPQLMILLDEIT